jgi:hypothetical protein
MGVKMESKTCGNCRHFDGFDRCEEHDEWAERDEKGCWFFQVSKIRSKSNKAKAWTPVPDFPMIVREQKFEKWMLPAAIDAARGSK